MEKRKCVCFGGGYVHYVLKVQSCQSVCAHTAQWNALSKHHNLCPGYLVFSADKHTLSVTCNFINQIPERLDPKWNEC